MNRLYDYKLAYYEFKHTVGLIEIFRKKTLKSIISTF